MTGIQMSIHRITMIVRWAVNAKGSDNQLLSELKSLPSERRKNDPRLKDLMARLKNQWANGTRIEKLATLGWIDSESIDIFSDMLDNWAEISTQYKAELALRGKPPPLDDKHLTEYENTVKIVTSQNR
jgi:hypothetical protein